MRFKNSSHQVNIRTEKREREKQFSVEKLKQLIRYNQARMRLDNCLHVCADPSVPGRRAGLFRTASEGRLGPTGGRPKVPSVKSQPKGISLSKRGSVREVYFRGTQFPSPEGSKMKLSNQPSAKAPRKGLDSFLPWHRVMLWVRSCGR